MGLSHIWKCTLAIVSEQCWSRPVKQDNANEQRLANQGTDISQQSLKTCCLAWVLPWLPRGSWASPSYSSGQDPFELSKSIVRTSIFTLPYWLYLPSLYMLGVRDSFMMGRGNPWCPWPQRGLRTLTGRAAPGETLGSSMLRVPALMFIQMFTEDLLCAGTAPCHIHTCGCWPTSKGRVRALKRKWNKYIPAHRYCGPVESSYGMTDSRRTLASRHSPLSYLSKTGIET